jgi:hypothetical protein
MLRARDVVSGFSRTSQVALAAGTLLRFTRAGSAQDSVSRDFEIACHISNTPSSMAQR